MDFSQFMPWQVHPALAWLGKQAPWLLVQDIGAGRSSVKTDINKIRNAKDYQEHEPYLNSLLKEGESRSLILHWVNAMSNCLAFGPKLFTPTLEQFDSMQHVDLNIPISDYRQPFPSMVIATPKEFKSLLAEYTGIPLGTCPDATILHASQTIDGKVMIFSGHHFKDGMDNSYFFQDRIEFPTIEDAITVYVGEPTPEHLYSEIVTRVCLNLMLMLTHYGYKETGPFNPQDYAKHRRKPALQRYAFADFLTVDLDKQIVVRQERPPTDAERGEATGRELEPHWRRGHWKNQRHGVKLTLSKRIFVQPVFVRLDRAVGDLSMTKTTYKIYDRRKQ